MVQKQQTGIRLPDELFARIDGYVERLRKEQPGLDVNRAMAIRLLITKGLDAAEQQSKKPKQK